MVQVKLQVKDVYALKESLKVALEVTYSDLSIMQYESIKNFTHCINSDQSSLKITKELNKDLIICLNIFKTSRTWHWIKEDFKTAVNEFVYTLNIK